MVIFDDLQKLLLYQRLNLGFECHVCKRKFYNRLDHLEHISNCKTEQLKCQKCAKTFGHPQILQLHMQFHNLSESSISKPPNIQNTNFVTVKQECIELTDSEDEGTLKQTNTEEETKSNISFSSLGQPMKCETVELNQITSAEDQLPGSQSVSLPESFKILQSQKKPVKHKSKEKPKQVKKRVGLTKIRMEDCLRCDDCSCIYIDEKDYYKHMRNFHQRDMNNVPILQQKTKRKCRSCCKQCRGVHCIPIKKPRATQRASNLIFKINMRDNIKDRWTKMVSQQLSGNPEIDSITEPNEEPIQVKPDPDAIMVKQEPDLSHLLSQVEVKIKTEPPDDY